MSKYTTEVRFICEEKAGYEESQGYQDIDTIISKSRNSIFGNYPIFDEAYRSVLETKILRHYYTREICAETVGRWLLFLNSKMNEIMPYYNKMYKSELIEFNPMYDTDLTTTRETEGSGNETSSETNNSTENITENIERDITESETINRDISGTETLIKDADSTSQDTSDDWSEYSDTPQGGLNGIAQHRYLTNATHNTHTGSGSATLDETDTTTNRTDDDTTKTGTTSDDTDKTGTRTLSGRNSGNKEMTSTEEYSEHIMGKRGFASFSSMLIEFRQTFLNIDMMIIEELSDLFFNLW